MKVSQIFSGDYLKAVDLQGHEPTVIIDAVEMKQFDDGNKLLLKFQGKQKGLVANKTNAGRIAKLYGDDTDAWIGKEIVLYTDQVDFQGSSVDAIRVRGPKKPAPAGEPAPF
jgi:hypothetical protein